MKSIYQVDYYRATRNPLFIICLLFSIVLAIGIALLSLQDLRSYHTAIQYLFREDKGLLTFSVYRYLMNYDLSQDLVVTFLRLLPLLCTLPYAWSLREDYNRHYGENLLLRESPKTIVLSKLRAVLITTTIMVCVPYLISTIGLACIWPATQPDPVDSVIFTVYPSTWLGGLFYAHPFIHTILTFLLLLISSLIWSAFVLGLSYFIKNKFAPLVIPFVGLYFVDFIDRMTYEVHNSAFSLIRISPAYYLPESITYILLHLLILVFLTAIFLHLWKNRLEKNYGI